jgi:hypothetical protein
VTVEALLQRQDMPKPNYLIGTSPGKWQTVWKVNGFGKSQAEDLQKQLSRQTGADPAATDCARVLRLPGFYNHKYAQPHLIRAERLADESYGPEQFPQFSTEDRKPPDRPRDGAGSKRGSMGQPLSQLERDWAYAKRALARGESPAMVLAMIATYRRYDKPNPRYYAETTVRKAAASLRSTEMMIATPLSASDGATNRRFSASYAAGSGRQSFRS